MRLAVVLSHPVQHFGPQFRSWSRHTDIRIKVLYGSSTGAVTFYDPDFAQTVNWGDSVMAGYEALLLDGKSDSPRPVNFRLDARDLADHLERFDPSVVLTFGYAQMIQLRARRWALRNKRTLAYVSDSENRQRGGKPPLPPKRAVVSRILRPYDIVLTVGDANEAYYTSLGVSASKLLRMGFPIDVDLYQTAWETRVELRAVTRDRLGIGDDEVVALVVGKLIERKRQIDVIRSCENSGIRVLLAGSGPNEKSLRSCIQDGRTNPPVFAGFTPPAQLPAIYAAADIYVHPSVIDPHPLAISEAIYMGLPIIVSDKVGSWGPTDDVVPDINGYVYQAEDTKQLRTLIHQLAWDLPLREKFGQASRQRAIEKQFRSHGGFLPELISRVT
jgi:glycosyltransferase involved in cell wall biosynthesis